MKKSVCISFALFVGIACAMVGCHGCHAAEMRWNEVKISETQIVTNQVAKSLEGRFWTEWRVETNAASPTRPVMEKFALEQNPYKLGIISITNGNIIYWNYNGWVGEPCQKEHFDSSPQQEVTYCQSNLWSFITWRGRTNSDCLESICFRTNVAQWHWEKIKKYTQR